jgi:hypothetical protein
MKGSSKKAAPRHYVNLRCRLNSPLSIEKDSLARAAKYSKTLRAELVAMQGPLGLRVGQSLALEFHLVAGKNWLRLCLDIQNGEVKQSIAAAKLFPALGLEVVAQDSSRYLLFHLLNAFENAVASALKADEVTNRGGRKRKYLREIVIVNLAKTYEELGRKPSSRCGSAFSGFVRDVFELVGWHTQIVGLDDAIPAANAARKNYTKK